MSTAALYAGVPLDRIATRTATKETVTRYDTVTGKPHQAEVTTVTYETTGGKVKVTGTIREFLEAVGDALLDSFCADDNPTVCGKVFAFPHRTVPQLELSLRECLVGVQVDTAADGFGMQLQKDDSLGWHRKWAEHAIKRALGIDAKAQLFLATDPEDDDDY